jgi:hypothetical protein
MSGLTFRSSPGFRPRHSWVLNDFRPADGVAFSAPATDSGKISICPRVVFAVIDES